MAIPASQSLETLIGGLEKALGEAADKAPNKPAKPTGPGPGKIKTLALFGHGTSWWMGCGTDVDTGNVQSVASSISSALTGDINVILYACSVARGQNEENSWVNTTTKDGGADSLASTLRDALMDEGKDEATVWGHTEVGHTSRNFTLREFDAGDGKGTDGNSFVSTYVWDYATEGVREVQAAVTAQGYEITDQARFERTVKRGTQRWIYRRYSAARSSLQPPCWSIGKEFSNCLVPTRYI